MATYTDPYGIADYKPFCIQRGGVDSAAIDLRERFWLVSRANPYPLLPSPKDIYKNAWLDEDGDEEYNERMFYEAFEFEVGFIIKAQASGGKSADAIIREKVDAFFTTIRSGEFCTWDAYTGLGFRGVRYAGFKEDSYKARGDWARAQFTVTFKANDPLTRVGLFSAHPTYITLENSYLCSAAGTRSDKSIAWSAEDGVEDGTQIGVRFRYGNTTAEPRLIPAEGGNGYAIKGLPASGWTDAMKASYYLLEYDYSQNAFINKGIV